MALAFVVPCQAGGSVLLQPHGHAVADVLPAIQKIAESGRERERERESGGEQKQREDVRFCMTEVSLHHFLISCLPLPVEMVAMPVYGMADFEVVSFFFLSFVG